MLLHRVSVLPDESLIVALLSSLIVALQGWLRLKNILIRSEVVIKYTLADAMASRSG
jgi:hypothetical protein